MSLVSTIPSTFQLWFTLTVIVLLLIILAIDRAPPHHVMLAAVIILWNTDLFDYPGRKILTVQEALAGFSSTSLMTNGGLFVPVAAIEKSRVVHWLALYVLGLKSGQLWGSFKLQVFAFLLSPFTNNVPLQALLLPIVCNWCRVRGFPSSKFLLPQNYANLSGGLLATIGTSSNLIVNGLLVGAKEKPFGFFEPAQVALPLGIIGIFWMLLMHRFLPDNSEGFLKSVRDRSSDYVVAFELSPHSRFVGRKIHDVLANFALPSSDLLKVRRQSGAGGASQGRDFPAMTWKGWCWAFFSGRESPEHYQLVNSGAVALVFDRSVSAEDVGNAGLVELTDVSADEVAQAGDVFVMTLRPEVLIEAVGDSKRHLLPSSEPVVARILSKCDIVEVVLGAGMPLVGTPIRSAADNLEKLYNVGLLAVRKEGPSQAGATEEVQDLEAVEEPIKVKVGEDPEVFRAGDKLLVLAPPQTELPRGAFLGVRTVAPLRRNLTFYDIVPVLLFIAGVTWASVEDHAMVRVAVGLFCIMVLGGWIDSDEVAYIMDWDLLILMGTSIALGTALNNSGLANAVGVLVRAAGLNPQGALFLLVTAVIILNEIVTNNASVTLGIPLAVSLTKELKLKSVRPYALAVMIGGSAAYACPIGYATHMMVMGPGNYTFGDFFKFGLLLDLIFIAGVTLILPGIMPLE